MIGWRRFGQALPNDAHHALARLEANGQCKAFSPRTWTGCTRPPGSRAVIDFHGRLDLVRCMACSATSPRGDFQDRLVRLNAAWAELDATALPDGDADLDHLDFTGFTVPPCAACGGVLKPDVVFFGESVPRDQVSPWPWSTWRTPMPCSSWVRPLWSIPASASPRLPRAAASRSPAVNLGRTRADDLLALKVEDRCEAALSFLL
jgi:NAD-dependent SIR2 family protein deacetylase